MIMFMQRIVRSSETYSSLDSRIHNCNQILNEVCPPHLAQLFAVCRQGSDGLVEWWSPLGGQAIPLAALSSDQQARLLKIFEQRKESLAEIAAELDGSGQAEAAQQIRERLTESDLSHLYSIDNHPVVVNWHRSAVKQAVATAVPVDAAKKRRWWPWLLLLLLLLLAAVLALFWYWQKGGLNSQPASTPPAETIESIPASIDSYACRPQTGQPIPELVTVFDTSGSMTLNIHATAEDEYLWLRRDVPGVMDLDHLMRIMSEPTREQVAKRAYAEMLASLHPDIATRLITFQGCETVVDHGLYDASQRSLLMQTLQGIAADYGTPLTASLRHAAASVDGVNADAVIILFIDGEDGCGEDVCALSEQLAQSQPRLKVNVVDVSGNGLSHCVAQATGGRIYSTQDIAQISEVFVQAVAELADGECHSAE